MKNKKNELVRIAGLWSALFVFLASTDPFKLPAALLAAPILWMFLCIVYTMFILQKIISSSSDKSDLSRLWYGVIVAMFPTLILLLRSINQLTFKDLVLVLILATVGIGYVKRFRFAQKID